ncbi:MAG TPA: sugar transferase [Rhodocyclaceae bacterium]|nr:sugar transferase [Rhodocyclaceae bacterium]
MIKRLFDLIVASILIVLLLPLMLIVALLVRYKLGHPLLFRQRRPGLKGEVFTVFKFRTMQDAHDTHGNLLDDDKRITDFGRSLRRLSLDELPQLFNVLRGDMSFVGPRPLLMEYLPLYSPTQARRHDVRPGITGWAQVNGRNAIDWSTRLALDVWYVDHASMMLDFKILCMTIARVFRGDGVSAPGEATVKKFTGQQSDHDN